MSRNYRNTGRFIFKDAISRDSYANQYEPSRLALEEEMKTRVTRGHSSRSRGTTRKAYQEKRVVQNRRENNKITENDLAEELRKKLFPGVKNGESAMDRLEALNTFKAITLTVTTRSIGIGVSHIFYSLFEFQNVPIRGNIYQMYRVCLAIFETKIQICQRGVAAIQNNEDDYAELLHDENLISAVKSVTMFPDQISSVIRNVGKVRLGTKLYVPKMAKDSYTRHELFIPVGECTLYKFKKRRYVFGKSRSSGRLQAPLLSH